MELMIFKILFPICNVFPGGPSALSNNFSQGFFLFSTHAYFFIPLSFFLFSSSSWRLPPRPSPDTAAWRGCCRASCAAALPRIPFSPGTCVLLARLLSRSWSRRWESPEGKPLSLSLPSGFGRVIERPYYSTVSSVWWAEVSQHPDSHHFICNLFCRSARFLNCHLFLKF